MSTTPTADTTEPGRSQPTRSTLSNDELRTLLGAQFRRFRMAAGMPMTEFAKRAGVTKSFVSQVEGGKALPNIDNLRLFAGILGVTLGEIFDFDARDSELDQA